MKISKYKQIESYIEDQIISGKLNPGDQIETEEDLAHKFGFSRMTINKALNNLANRHLIQRSPGKGSFVSQKHVKKKITPKIASFTEDMEKIGLKASSELLGYELIRANSVPFIKESLEIKENIFLHYFKRLRLGDGIPIAVSENYISSEILTSIDINALEGSLYKYLEDKQLYIINNEMEFSAELPSQELSDILRLENEAIFKTVTISYVKYHDEKRKIGYFITRYNGDLYSYTI